MASGTGINSLSPRQAANARAIVAVGQRLGLPRKAYIIAIATALQESNLGDDPTHSKPNRDGDAGVFQQRVKPGWYGTLEQVNDINYAATVFYEGKKITDAKPGGAGPVGYTIPGLKQIKGWELLPVTVAAQKVQVSAFPTAYAKHEKRATQIVDDVLASGGGMAADNIGLGMPSEMPRLNVKQWALMILGIILISVALVRLSGADKTIATTARAAVKVYTKGLV